jgi:chromosome segregation ATPase
MVALLSDPSRLEAEFARLNAAKASAQEVIDLAGPASEITKIRAEIDVLKAQSEQALADANTSAQAILARAEEERRHRISDGEAQAQQLAAQATQQLVNAQAQAQQAQDAQAAADAKAAEVARQESALQSDRAAVAAKETELKQREEQLAARVSALASIKSDLADALKALGS